MTPNDVAMRVGTVLNVRGFFLQRVAVVLFRFRSICRVGASTKVRSTSTSAVSVKARCYPVLLSLGHVTCGYIAQT